MERPAETSTVPEVHAGQPVEVALPQLVEEHGGRLYRIALRLCGHPDDAEELVQDIFLIAWKSWDEFRGESSPTTWLYTIAARACGRRRRRRAGEPKTLEPLSELLPDPEDDVPDVARLAEGPFEEQLRREAREAVEGGIARLPERFRMPLVLKEIVELPIAEVAEILGLKEATVKTRVHRGRLALRRELAKTLPQRPAPPPDHSRRMCLDLLQAKQEALDRGVPFRVPPQELCDRCRALFTTLDLAGDVCRDLGRGELPPALREKLASSLATG